MEPVDDNHLGRECMLSELLRSTLWLVEYYGRLEANESTLSELKAALIRTIERLDANEATEKAAGNGVEFNKPGSPRKGPHGQTIDTTQLDKKAR